MELITKIMIFVLGSCLGSFYACIGYRIPNKISLTKPNSFCPNCKKGIKWYMNIPLLSYILLKGKCAYCKSKIDPLSFIIELLTGTFFLGSYIMFGLGENFIISVIIISALMVTIVSDFEYYYISDRVIFISAILTLITRVYFNGFAESIKYILSGTMLFLMMLGLKTIGDKVLKKECLGGGDIKLMLLIGITLGFYYSLVSIFIGSLIALICSLIIMKKKNNEEIPYGPFLLIGTLISFIIMAI